MEEETDLKTRTATKILQVGDTVMWRHSWGRDAPKPAVVEAIYLTENHGAPRYRHSRVTLPNLICDFISDEVSEGVKVEAAHYGVPFLVDLDNGHWAYSNQLVPVEVSA